MAISVGKLAPSAVVLAFVGYCTWPSLSDLTSTLPPPKAPPKVAEVAASLFSPTMPPVPTRNPWGGLDAAELAAAKETAKPVDTQSEAVVEAAMAQKTSAEPTNPLAGLKLDATSILGDQRVAVISGQMCSAQELVTFNDARYRVVRVLPYKVVLERDGKIMELTYSSVASDSAKPKEDGVKATPASMKTSNMKKPSDAPEPQSLVGSLIKKHTSAWESIMEKREAAEAAAMSGVIDQPKKAGN